MSYKYVFREAKNLTTETQRHRDKDFFLGFLRVSVPPW